MGNIISVLSLGFLAYLLVENFSELPNVEMSIANLGYVAAVLMLCTIAQLFSAYTLTIFLKSKDSSIPYLRVLQIHGKTVIAKYLPGNFFHYVMRLSAAKSNNIDVGKMAIASMGELAAAITAAFAIGLPGLYFYEEEVFRWLPTDNLKTALLFMVLIGVFVLATLLVIPKIRHWIWQRVSGVQPSDLLVSFILNILDYCFYGICLVMLCIVLTISPHPSWWDFTWGFALAWVIGLVTPGAPGGIGVRELILYGIFSSVLGTAIGSALFLTMRIFTTMSELVVFAVALGLEHRQQA